MDIVTWKKKHPRSSKKYPGFYVDCDLDGTKERCPAPYSWQSIVKLILERDNKQCRICGTLGHHLPWQDKKGMWWRYCLDVHHIIPKIQGGSNHPKNLISICQTCHKKIHSFSPGSFKEKIIKIFDQKSIKLFL